MNIKVRNIATVPLLKYSKYSGTNNNDDCYDLSNWQHTVPMNNLSLYFLIVVNYNNSANRVGNILIKIVQCKEEDGNIVNNLENIDLQQLLFSSSGTNFMATNSSKIEEVIRFNVKSPVIACKYYQHEKQHRFQIICNDENYRKISQTLNSLGLKIKQGRQVIRSYTTGCGINSNPKDVCINRNNTTFAIPKNITDHNISRTHSFFDATTATFGDDTYDSDNITTKRTKPTVNTNNPPTIPPRNYNLDVTLNNNNIQKTNEASLKVTSFESNGCNPRMFDNNNNNNIIPKNNYLFVGTPNNNNNNNNNGGISLIIDKDYIVKKIQDKEFMQNVYDLEEIIKNLVQ
ncbi:Rec114p SCDLUD_002635 [Saccharomycodes ludwigii]|uniref:Rec114p n=1 Tax=Saccharomycodes ludwigii TaxID=36035 RepID=UPI001E87BE37|nr:hypothetical protein SCDLUD_002635 [Saccharomycodes ludwigii]KAH3901152.1 hypothetical protein SCDLUD_002635 [Saccharomycodes ludwigii]